MRAAAVAGMAAMLVSACAGQPPLRQGDGSLASCDGASECVSSQAQDPEHQIEPLRYSGPSEDARKRLLAVLAAMPRVRFVVSVPNYVHVEVKSQLMGHLDDVEFLFSSGDTRIDMRAASRGSGLGADDNRARLESIRRSFAGN